LKLDQILGTVKTRPNMLLYQTLWGLVWFFIFLFFF